MATMAQQPNIQPPPALAAEADPSPPSELEQQQAALVHVYQQYLQANGRDASEMTQEDHVKTFNGPFRKALELHAQQQQSQQTEVAPHEGREVESTLGESMTDTSAAGLTSAASTTDVTLTENAQEKSAAQADVTDTQANTVPIKQGRFAKYQPSVVDAKDEGAGEAGADRAADMGKGANAAPPAASQAPTAVTDATLPESAQANAGVRFMAQPAATTAAEQTTADAESPSVKQNTSSPRQSFNDAAARSGQTGLGAGTTSGRSPMSIKQLQDLLKRYEYASSRQQSELSTLRQENEMLKSTMDQRLKEQSAAQFEILNKDMEEFRAKMTAKFTDMESELKTTIRNLTEKNQMQAQELKELRSSFSTLARGPRWEAGMEKIRGKGETEATGMDTTQTAGETMAPSEPPKLAPRAKVETTQGAPTALFAETDDAVSQVPGGLPVVYLLPIDKSNRFSHLDSEESTDPYRSYGLPRSRRALPSYGHHRSANPYSTRRPAIPRSSYADPFSLGPHPVFSRLLSEHRTSIPFTDEPSARRYLFEELNQRMDDAILRGTPGILTMTSEVTLPDGSKITGTVSRDGRSEW